MKKKVQLPYFVKEWTYADFLEYERITKEFAKLFAVKKHKKK